jgi:hypothetical protein
MTETLRHVRGNVRFGGLGLVAGAVRFVKGDVARGGELGLEP